MLPLSLIFPQYNNSMLPRIVNLGSALICQSGALSPLLSVIAVAVVAGILSLKNESSIFRSVIQHYMWFWKCQASSPETKQYRA